MLRYLTYASVIALAAGAARAQEAPEPDVAGVAGASALREVVVTATRSPQPVERIGASVTVVTEQAIDASQAVAVVDLLEELPGVFFTRNGGPGTASSLNIRGAEGQHTVVLIDGVKLNDPSATQGAFNFGNLLVGDVSRIEVLRGAQSTLWGSQAVGGVVNIVTATPQAPVEAALDAEVGAHGAAYVRVGAGGAGERLSWRLAAARFETQGGFSASSFGTEEDGYRNTGLSGRLRLAITDQAEFELRSVYSDGRTEFDGFNADSPETGRTEELVAYAGLNLDTLGGRLKHRLAFAYTDTDRANRDPRRALQPVTFQAAGENRRWEYQGTLAAAEGWNAVFGAESERAQMRTRAPANTAALPAFGTGRAGVDSVYGQVQVEAAPGLTLTGGLRFEDHQTYGEQLLGQAAAAWRLNDGATVLRASFGQGFRAPGLYELYSEYGNLGLEPETFDSWEIGVEQALFGDAVRVSAAVFRRESENEIRFASCFAPTSDPLCAPGGTPRFGYYRNTLRTEAQGLELIGRWQATARLAVAGNYSYVDAEVASGPNAGRRLIRRPEHLANLNLTYTSVSGLSATAAVRYVGETFQNDANTILVEDYALVDLRASYPLNARVELYGRVENALDEDYQTLLNFGTAGRGAHAGLRVRF